MFQKVKNLPAVQGTQVPSLGRKGPFKEERATHSSILWEIPWTGESGGLQSRGSQRDRAEQLILSLSMIYMTVKMIAVVSYSNDSRTLHVRLT